MILSLVSVVCLFCFGRFIPVISGFSTCLLRRCILKANSDFEYLAKEILLISILNGSLFIIIVPFEGYPWFKCETKEISCNWHLSVDYWHSLRVYVQSWMQLNILICIACCKVHKINLLFFFRLLGIWFLFSDSFYCGCYHSFQIVINRLMDTTASFQKYSK